MAVLISIKIECAQRSYYYAFFMPDLQDLDNTGASGSQELSPSRLSNPPQIYLHLALLR